MTVVDGAFDNALPLEEHAAMPLAGGVAGMGFQCGQVWGAALAAGAQAHQCFGPGPQAEAAAVITSQTLVGSFRNSYKSINCADVTQMDWKRPKAREILGYFLKGGVVRCFSMTAGYARAAFEVIRTADFETLLPEPPFSCAALLAQKIGSSNLHATMVAGFAGGIGLSGGACGALGAAVWFLSMKNRSDAKTDLYSPEVMDLIDRFVEISEVKFECSEIAGRKFHTISDHADYLRDGGCSKIIEALANWGRVGNKGLPAIG